MCGLFGYTGIEKPSVDKLKLLGIINTRRGTDSCGYYMTNGTNSNIKKGVDTNADFVNFVANGNFTINDDTKIVIGHTRKSTMGQNTVENAHPFDINNGELVGAHNGVIKNWYVLRNKFNIKENFTVDSHAFLTMINIDMERALKLYDGAAALLFRKNGKLHVYKGASWKTATQYYDNAQKKWIQPETYLDEERPMFTLKTKNGYYFSSIKQSLELIKEKGDELLALESNIVYVFEGNKLAEKIKIERKPFIENGFNYGNSKVTSVEKKPYQTTLFPAVSTNSSIKSTIPTNSTNSLFKTIPANKNAVHYSNFRYVRKGQVLDGIFRINPYGHINSKFNNTYYFFKGILLNDVISDEEYKNALIELLPAYNEVMSVVSKIGKITLYHMQMKHFVNTLRKYTDVPIYFEEFQTSLTCDTDIKSNKRYNSLFSSPRVYYFSSGGFPNDSKAATIFDVDFNTLLFYGEEFWKKIYFEDKLHEDSKIPQNVKDVILLVAHELNFITENNSNPDSNFNDNPVIEECKLKTSEFFLSLEEIAMQISNINDEFDTLNDDLKELNPEFADKFYNLFVSPLWSLLTCEEEINQLSALAWSNEEMFNTDYLETAYES